MVPVDQSPSSACNASDHRLQVALSSFVYSEPIWHRYILLFVMIKKYAPHNRIMDSQTVSVATRLSKLLSANWSWDKLQNAEGSCFRPHCCAWSFRLHIAISLAWDSQSMYNMHWNAVFTFSLPRHFLLTMLIGDPQIEAESLTCNRPPLSA